MPEKAALYCRLSNDYYDSESIQNQKELLMQYAQKKLGNCWYLL